MKIASVIRNPLTVIGVFASLVEIGGTTVLPFLNDEAQSTYLWFLMIFPSVLVALFFLTLNFNHKVLYAPSDFTDERHFIELLKPQTPRERREGLIREAEELENEHESGATESRPESIEDNRPAQRPPIDRHRLISRIALAEQDALLRIGNEFNAPVQANVRVKRLEVDGLLFTDEGVVLIDVKYIRHSKNLMSRVIDAATHGHRALHAIPSSERGKRPRVIIALACDTEETADEVQGRLRRLEDGPGLPFAAETRVFVLDDPDTN